MFYRIFSFTLLIILSACSVGQSAALPTAAIPATALTSSAPTAAAAAPATPDPSASLPPIAAPTAAAPTPLPSLPPLPTPTITATAAPTVAPPHPMSVEVQRSLSYPGSAITIERELDRGSNYSRYYASYRSEGLKIYALLTIPDGEIPEGGFPAIVFNHGYIPPTVYRTTERYIAYVDWLARAGYVVFRIDYRGHDQSEGRASGAYGDPGYTADVLNALASLSQHPQVNPQKIGMWGHSMGGFLTLRAMVIARQSGAGDIKAGVIWGGVVASYPDMLTQWRRGTRTGPTPTPPAGARRWRTEWIQNYGTPEQNPTFWASVSANSYLSDLSGPIQLHHSTTDEEVPVIFSETLAQQGAAAGKIVELYTYPGDNHNISGSFAAAMTQTIAFFDTYLK